MQGLTRSKNSPLVTLEVLEVEIRDVSCWAMQSCLTAKHDREGASDLGRQLKEVLSKQGFPSIARLKLLKIQACVVVKGLSDMTEVMETVECHCEARPSNLHDVMASLHGWHDLPLHREVDGETIANGDLHSRIEALTSSV